MNEYLILYQGFMKILWNFSPAFLVLAIGLVFIYLDEKMEQQR